MSGGASATGSPPAAPSAGYQNSVGSVRVGAPPNEPLGDVVRDESTNVSVRGADRVPTAVSIADSGSRRGAVVGLGRRRARGHGRGRRPPSCSSTPPVVDPRGAATGSSSSPPKQRDARRRRARPRARPPPRRWRRPRGAVGARCTCRTLRARRRHAPSNLAVRAAPVGAARVADDRADGAFSSRRC